MSAIAFRLVAAGDSRSFPAGDPFLSSADDAAETVVIIGGDAASAAKDFASAPPSLVLVELDLLCLGDITGEQMGLEGGRVLGFSRYRLGSGEPSQLVELVAQPQSDEDAKAKATALFEAAGFSVSICADRPGRIVDRLVRPYFNSALERLDDGLASGADIDRAVMAGLGFKRGPIAWLHETGLADHARVSQALSEAYADPAFRPARRARVASRRGNGA